MRPSHPSAVRVSRRPSHPVRRLSQRQRSQLLRIPRSEPSLSLPSESVCGPSQSAVRVTLPSESVCRPSQSAVCVSLPSEPACCPSQPNGRQRHRTAGRSNHCGMREPGQTRKPTLCDLAIRVSEITERLRGPGADCGPRRHATQRRDASPIADRRPSIRPSHMDDRGSSASAVDTRRRGARAMRENRRPSIYINRRIAPIYILCTRQPRSGAASVEILPLGY